MASNTNDENLKTLVDMGFNEEKCKKAIALNETLNDAMEWLLAHNNDDMDTSSAANTQPSSSNETSLKLKLTDTQATTDEATGESPAKESKIESDSADTAKEEVTEEATEATSEQLQANSLRCDDCGKLLKDTDAATAHMYKTNHTSFSESAETIKPKSPEEIEAQKKQLQEKLIKLRAEKQEKEKQEEIEREKNRRKHGRELNELRQKMHEDELKRIAEERRREKLAAEAQKRKIKEQIAQDRERLKQEQQQNQPQVAPPATKPVAAVTTVPGEKRTYDECKIQVRLTDGKAMMQTFKSKEQLAAVRLWIEMNRTDERGPFNLVQPFPRKQFTNDDMMRTLEDLGLTPASSLIITRR